MKYSIAVKFIAFLLCACSLVVAVGCAAGIFYLGEYDLYNRTIEERKQQELENIGFNLAWYHARQYAAETYSDCSEEVLDYIYSQYGIYSLYSDDLSEYQYSITIAQDSKTLQSTNFGNKTLAKTADTASMTYTIRPAYPMTHQDGVAPASEDFTHSEHLWTYSDGMGNYTELVVDYYQAPEVEVTVTFSPDIVYSSDIYTVTELLYLYRYDLIYVLLGSLLLFAITLVYLCCAAGRTKGTTDIRPMGLNRLPLDLYAAGVFVGCMGLGCLGIMFLEWAFDSSSLNLAGIILAGTCALGCSLLCIAFVFAFAAQAKIRNHYWLRHTLCGWCIGKLFQGIRWCFRGCRAVFQMLPLIWQWLLTAFLMVCIVALTFLLTVTSYGIFNLFWGCMFFASIIGCIGIVCYGAWAFGVLIQGARIMAQGHLYYQINTKHLIGCFRDFALQLNSLGGAARIAAANQLKSERMKTELITNVSHDIKTPLTSIINYVDLLQKPHTDQEQASYLEVLSRQSQRLKKLIDDLMDMSKASTGNMNVEISRVDAVESVNQALGEFADKLETAGLTPVFRHPETPVTILADGKLTWRVLSNLLSNAVKYAMPGTRLYLDLMQLEGSVVISMKNISREELNVNADELMERFVRGDQARNTEGSGLGLNIAKSLMDLQKGQLQLLVDGDLFKVTLIFPAG